MPRPPHLCSCGKIVPHGITCPCKITATRARNKRHDTTRPNARARGYTRQWEAARALFLCQHAQCAHPGCTARATVVDHIIPHRGDHTLFWDKGNWQPLCAHHHNSHKQRQERST
ncbi:HNH endonuclease signature motif containing protein [Mameliella sp. AT18]|uniref:HNH endonuclease signature motif containing protein n=1 Tax=Mameliella sp. AT18 TaxID=3028385 RepID=UPI00237B8C01|nr:HNH endonuclease signature motif containing protein [Mameliella sp. AT18]MDD9730454.1 HNH endonuclease signature motif containing protein [Mameliella sp. AT18]